MTLDNNKLLLVGDNPFHGISHLSQERARNRGQSIGTTADDAALIISSALKNGANGFAFSVSDLNLSILKKMNEQEMLDQISLYPMVPYAFEYVRVATQTGTPGLVKRFAKQVVMTGNIKAGLHGLWSTIRLDPEGFVTTYLEYELSRIKSVAGKKANLSSVLLNEVIADMGLALDLEWLFKSFIKYLSQRDITPGFNTRNFPYLIKKFNEWGIDAGGILVETPFNPAGFQMNPSKKACEATLTGLKEPIVIAISILAAGYFKPQEVLGYIKSLSNLKGVAVGVSSEKQAIELFGLLSKI